MIELNIMLINFLYNFQKIREMSMKENLKPYWEFKTSNTSHWCYTETK